MNAHTHSPQEGSLSFNERVQEAQGALVNRAPLHTLQVNLGKRCNMACLHCHVEAGPNRTEEMSAETVDEVIALLERAPQLTTLDLTGGAPELNPHFRRLVKRATTLGRRVIDRCNLTILSEPDQEDLAEFLAAHRVEVVASLPCYLEENVTLQRGKGSFERSVMGLRRLNELGYGVEGSGLTLNLVYNPVGPSLPPAQVGLEEAYHRELEARYGVRFNHLLTITNMPIKRFKHQLKREERLEGYQALLEESFNAATLPGLMCRELVSVGWDGQLYDCDFNQMLELPLAAAPKTLSALLTLTANTGLSALEGCEVKTAAHCFGCTAGAGSSCGGALS